MLHYSVAVVLWWGLRWGADRLVAGWFVVLQLAWFPTPAISLRLGTSSHHIWKGPYIVRDQCSYSFAVVL